MVTMKSDMAGAAAVAATVLAAATCRWLVTGYLCLAKLPAAPPSGRATSSSCATARASRSSTPTPTDGPRRRLPGRREEPDWVVDIATLTGAQVVALGTDIAGVMANDDAFGVGSSTPRVRRGGRLADAAAGRATGEARHPDRRTSRTRATGTAACSRLGCSCSEFVARASRGRTDIADGVQRQGAQGYHPKGGAGLGSAPASPSSSPQPRPDARPLQPLRREIPTREAPAGRTLGGYLAMSRGSGRGQPPLLRRNICGVAAGLGAVRVVDLGVLGVVGQETSAPRVLLRVQRRARNFTFTSSSTAGAASWGLTWWGPPSAGRSPPASQTQRARSNRLPAANRTRAAGADGDPWACAGGRSTGASARGSR